MASGTKIRGLSRLLDTSESPVWVIDSAGKLAYLSAATAHWLGVDVEPLVGRRAVAGSPQTDELLDRLAAALSPPQGLIERGTASLRVQPPAIESHTPPELDVRFVRVGSDEPFIVAISGQFDDRDRGASAADSEAVRHFLDSWRRAEGRLAATATAGSSSAARRTRNRIQVAAATRCHVGIFGPPGCGGESIASRIHQLSAPGEPLVKIDGPLMDAELLDVSMIPVINQLSDSDRSQATALVRGLDEMPPEAQHRLADILAAYPGRLRLMGLCQHQPDVLREPLQDSSLDTDPRESADRPGSAEPRVFSKTRSFRETGAFPSESSQAGVDRRLSEFLSTLTVTVDPLSERTEDIPVIAAALVDACHASGDGAGERLSRTALDALVLYPWPGNFEELEQAIRHAVRIAPHAAIGLEHLPLAIRSYRSGGRKSGGEPAPSATSLDEAIRRYELQLIEAAVEAADGNRAEAARKLGISRARLIRRLASSQSSQQR